jgi:hypothetical protein
VIAVVLLVSGMLSPTLEAASACGEATAKAHACCCEHESGASCPCEVAPSTPRPQPLEHASAPASAARFVTALAPAVFALPTTAPLAAPAARFARHGHIAAARARLHLLEGVFRE